MATRGGRESGRLKVQGQRRILDDATRQRRTTQAVEALYNDNFHDDPHGDLVANKKAPKFQDTLNTRKTKKSKGADYYKFKYRKTFGQMIEYEEIVRPEQVHYPDAAAPAPELPKRNFCCACGFPSTYTCITCGAKFCSIPCQKLHMDTRCLKWTA
uniref:Zinc finger HIT domain-containing protein 1 n=1 Tax=Lygus hesperus TaxID=30085 RepID=A0A0A9YGN8_LYGHE